MYQTLDIERKDSVATIWMNRPEMHNAFNAQLVTELNEICHLLNIDESIRVVVLAGRGKSFSAGADLNEMKSASTSSIEQNAANMRQLAVMLKNLAQMQKPTLARVHGAALGGGMGLATACDICVASSTAVFATSEVRFGIIPAVISPYVLRAIGERQAYRYFQTAERISASRAYEIGLVHEVVDPDVLDAKVKEVIYALLQGGAQSQMAAKKLIRAVSHQPLTDALLEDTVNRIALLRSTPEAQEGLKAFLEKRPAAWCKESHL